MATSDFNKKPITAVAKVHKVHKIVAEAAERMKAKAKADKLATAKAKRDAQRDEARKQVQLKLWPETVRGVPDAMLRSALFSVSKERETFAKRTLIVSVGGIEIRYMNERLNQTDADVYITLLHFARLQPLGSEIKLTAYSILKALKRGTGGKDHKELDDQIIRLKNGFIEIRWIEGKKRFMGNLISDVEINEATKEYVITFNKKFEKLYANGYTLIDEEERYSLGQNSLAKFLHGLYSSHDQPYAYKVKTIHELCGSKIERLVDFRAKLRKALTELTNLGVLVNWSINEYSDLVHVTKPRVKQRDAIPTATLLNAPSEA